MRQILLAGVLLLALPGCRSVSTAVGRVLGGGPANVLDAHAVYLQRPGCATVAARTVRHGYSILTPLDTLTVEPAGLFEGPALEGQFVFRYVPPNVGETWDDARASSATPELTVHVSAVEVALPDVRAWLDAACGPLPPGEGEPGETVPRIPPRVGT